MESCGWSFYIFSEILRCIEHLYLVLHFLKFFEGREESAVSCCDCIDLAGCKAVGEQNGVDDEPALVGEIITMGA